METHQRKIRFYQDAHGHSLFHRWLGTIRDRKIRVRVLLRLDRIEFGNFGDCKSVGGGVLELRLDFGPGYRVYFAEDGFEIVLLLLGGDKSTQSKDIVLAKKFWNEYQGDKS